MLQVSTIQTENNDSALLTVADLRNYYGFKIQTASEAMFSRMIEAAQDACARYLGMESLKQKRSVSEFFQDSNGVKFFVLSANPLDTVTSVLDGARVLAPSDYRVDRNSGIVLVKSGASASEVEVQYVIGWGEDVPKDILYCVAMTVQKMAKDSQSARMGEISRSIEGGSENWEQTVVPQAVQNYLDKYRFNLAR